MHCPLRIPSSSYKYFKINNFGNFLSPFGDIFGSFLSYLWELFVIFLAASSDIFEIFWESSWELFGTLLGNLQKQLSKCRGYPRSRNTQFVVFLLLLFWPLHTSFTLLSCHLLPCVVNPNGKVGRWQNPGHNHISAGNNNFNYSCTILCSPFGPQMDNQLDNLHKNATKNICTYKFPFIVYRRFRECQVLSL